MEPEQQNPQRRNDLTDMLCLVVYVPKEWTEVVLKAIGDAGAGRMGNYSHCAFTSEGTGRFTPLPGAQPAIGAVGTPEQVSESRIEAILPATLRGDVVSAMLAAHPYEMPAFMTFRVDTGW